MCLLPRQAREEKEEERKKKEDELERIRLEQVDPQHLAAFCSAAIGRESLEQQVVGRY